MTPDEKLLDEIEALCEKQIKEPHPSYELSYDVAEYDEECSEQRGRKDFAKKILKLLNNT